MDAEAAKECDEGEAFRGDDEFLALAEEVAVEQQAFDRLRAGGGGAESALRHGLGEFLVLDEFAGAFHGGKERGFGVARGRAGLVLFDFEGFGFGRFAGLDRGDIGILASGVFSINGEPTRIGENFAIGLEGFLLDARDAGGDLEFGDREKCSDEAARDHVIDFQLEVIEFAGRNAGRDDREVVGDFGGVENAAVQADPAFLERVAGVRGEVLDFEAGEDFFDLPEVVIGEVARVGSRVGEDFVFFVKGLGDLERALGAEAKAGVRLALERGEVVKLGCNLGGGLFLFGDRARLAGALGDDRFRVGTVPEAFGLGVLIAVFFERFAEPPPAVGASGNAEIGENLEVGPWLEGADFLLALGENSEGGGLNAADGGELESPALRVEGGHGAGGIDANQPIAFAAANGGIGEWNHRFAGAEVRKAVADRVGRHTLEPETTGGLFRASEFDDVVENELALAAGVAGVHNLGDIRALQQALKEIQARGGFFYGLEVEVVGDNRKVGEAPLAALFIHLIREAKFDKVADRRGDDVRVVFEIIVLAGELPEGFGEIAGDGGFFGDNQGLGHISWRLL